MEYYYYVGGMQKHLKLQPKPGLEEEVGMIQNNIVKGYKEIY